MSLESVKFTLVNDIFSVYEITPLNTKWKTTADELQKYINISIMYYNHIYLGVSVHQS